MVDCVVVAEMKVIGCHGLYSTREPQATANSRVEYNPWHPVDPGTRRNIVERIPIKNSAGKFISLRWPSGSVKSNRIVSCLSERSIQRFASKAREFSMSTSRLFQ